MKGKLIILFICLLAGAQLSAQNLNRIEVKLYERYKAYQQIDSLKRFGVILFRLHDSSSTLKAVKSSARKAEIEKKLKRERLRIEELTTEFREQFDFCPLYFFYSDDNKHIMKGDVQGYLLDKYLQASDTLNPDLSYAFIASFSEFKTKHYPHRSTLTSWFKEEDTSSPLKGYNLKDLNQQQYFSPPFPSYGMSALAWNRALIKFYRKSKEELEQLKKHPKLIAALKKIASKPNP